MVSDLMDLSLLGRKLQQSVIQEGSPRSNESQAGGFLQSGITGKDGLMSLCGDGEGVPGRERAYTTELGKPRASREGSAGVCISSVLLLYLGRWVGFPTRPCGFLETP